MLLRTTYTETEVQEHISHTPVYFSRQTENKIKPYLILQVGHGHVCVVTSCFSSRANFKSGRCCHCGGFMLMRNITVAKFPFESRILETVDQHSMKIGFQVVFAHISPIIFVTFSAISSFKLPGWRTDYIDGLTSACQRWNSRDIYPTSSSHGTDFKMVRTVFPNLCLW